ncbi:MAG: VWA domain-containing protein, partial [Desulfobulbales bacterium]|nr:VWA domain-containing protein [Desulfobulbales bacterium]
MMKSKGLYLGILFGVASFVFTGCGSGGDGAEVSDSTTPKPYSSDPGDAPPAEIATGDRELVTSGSVAVHSSDPSLIEINIAGLIDPDTGLPYEDLTKSNFVVVEDGVVKGFVVEKISDSYVTSKADITFIIDTTGSMSGTINGVKDSVVNFLSYLESQKLDVQVSGVAYADAVVEAVDFSSDLTNSGSFSSWVNGLSAGYLGD